ncbi:Non-repetitive/WGA-negative nucleoporin C-terminal-domain-containing protein [Dipodascopsis uninucleata]
MSLSAAMFSAGHMGLAGTSPGTPGSTSDGRLGGSQRVVSGDRHSSAGMDGTGDMSNLGISGSSNAHPMMAPGGYPVTPVAGSSRYGQNIFQTPIRSGQVPNTSSSSGGIKNSSMRPDQYKAPFTTGATMIGSGTPSSVTGAGQGSAGAAIKAITPLGTSVSASAGPGVGNARASVANSTPLEYAKRTINDFLDRDARYPDLDRIIQQSQQSEYVVSGTNDASVPWTPFVRTRLCNIPDIIFDQYNKTECFTKMGVFPQLDRAWISVDNRLYFWNYMSGSDFLSFEDITHSIVAVALIRPKPGTFISSIKYLLLLATPLEFHLIGVAYENKDLQLYDTGMVVSVKGLDVNEIICSDRSGRIFFTGRGSSDVWEITYSNTESWFRGKCGKVCHTKSGLAGYSPSLSALAPLSKAMAPLSGASIISSIFPGSIQQEYVMATAVDDARKLIYTLSSRSTLRAYHMGSPTELHLVITYTYASLCSHLQMINATSPLLDPRTTTIVSIHPVRPTESSQIHLIATTSTGCRLYLRAARTYGFGFMTTNDFSVPPTTMQVIQVRFPPRDSADRPPSMSQLLKKTKFSKMFAPGYFFAVREGDLSDSLFVSAADTARILLQSSTSTAAPQLVETAAWADIEGFVQAIELITPEFQVSSRPEGFGNEVCGQYILPPTEVAVLTNTGVHIYTRRYMPQTFMHLGSEARIFLELYGRAEACSTALSVACSSSSPLDSREIARKAYIEFGGKAHLRDDNYGQLVFSLDSVRLSGRFDGLATYISRIVREIWRLPILKIISGNGNQKSFACNVSADKLGMYQLLLYELYDFLEQNRNYIDGLSGPDRSTVGGFSGSSSNGAGSEELSMQAEHRGMHSLVELTNFMREGLSFVGLVTSESKKLNEIMAILPEKTQNKIVKLTFQDLFTAPEGTELAKELVAAIVNQSIATGGLVDSIVDVLRKKCGTFCSADDVILFKAIEYLRKAKTVAATDPDLKMQYLRESVRLLEKAAGTIQSEELSGAVDELLSLGFHPGAVEVALRAAAETDRGNIALGYFIDGCPALDSREEIFVKRTRCYELVFSILDAIDSTVEAEQQNVHTSNISNSDSTAPFVPPSVALQSETYGVAYASKDELFHYCFYDWFVSRGLANRLLEVDTPYVEPYLERNARTSLQQADLLWVFESKKEQYLKAAQVLYQLARSDFELSLSQRIEYLSRARGFCNCYCPPSQRQTMLRLLQTTQDELEVAYIQDDILSRVSSDERFAKNNETKESQRSIINRLDGKVSNLTVLYNEFASPLGYNDICQAIFKAADYNG